MFCDHGRLLFLCFACWHLPSDVVPASPRSNHDGQVEGDEQSSPIASAASIEKEELNVLSIN